MDELLQKHGCSNVFTVPEGLKELMADITREVLRDQPYNIFDYIANYLSILLITRENGVMAVKILDDLCDCKPSVADHLIQLGFEKTEADMIADIIKFEVQNTEPTLGKETVKETAILKKILNKIVLDEDSSARVCQVARNAYRDYWYRKKLFAKHFKFHQDEPWEIAAHRTLELYKKTKPSFSELTRATQRIQAAYRGYHIRRNILKHLVPKDPQKKKGGFKKKQRPKVDLAGPPVDIGMERDIDLGPVIDLNVKEDNVKAMFDVQIGETLGLKYDPKKTITHVDEEFLKIKTKPKPQTVTVESMFQTVSNRQMQTVSQTEVKKRSSLFDNARRSKTATDSYFPHTILAKGHRKNNPDSLNKKRTAARFYHRISFAQYPAEIIIDDGQEEVPEESPTKPLHQVRIVGNVQTPEFKVQDAKTQDQEIEIQDYKAPEEIWPLTDDVVEDVAEDIQDDQSAGGDDSVDSDLTATVATDNATDPEDTDDEVPDDLQ